MISFQILYFLTAQYTQLTFLFHFSEAINFPHAEYLYTMIIYTRDLALFATLLCVKTLSPFVPFFFYFCMFQSLIKSILCALSAVRIALSCAPSWPVSKLYTTYTQIFCYTLNSIIYFSLSFFLVRKVNRWQGSCFNSSLSDL